MGQAAHDRNNNGKLLMLHSLLIKVRKKFFKQIFPEAWNNTTIPYNILYNTIAIILLYVPMHKKLAPSQRLRSPYL